MVWQNGQQKEANNFSMRIATDNLKTTCVFYYEMQNVQELLTEIQTTTVIDTLTFGNLTLQGEEYQTWDADPSANEWAYEWAAGQLNLVLIPETV